MWTRIRQRLGDPLSYRKRWRQIGRILRPPPPPRPVELEEVLAAGSPLLGVIAHPDDELFCSGLIREAVLRGSPVHLACLTRGEGGPTGGLDRDGLGATRETELRASAAALGVSSVHFLGYVDPPASEFRVHAPPVSPATVAGEIRGLLGNLKPGAFVTHGSAGEYWHPAHLLVRRAVLLAAEGRHPVLTMQAWQPDHPLPGLLNRDDPADLRIDGTLHREARLAALLAHASQAGYFARHAPSPAEFIRLTAREAYRHYPPARG